ncbi:DUF6714 family protein [Acinetobacter pollinis]|uniref:DUF6714 family protein n=1 Tax=Acinetobacter pollinis TaxID=2605270 RepID=UPI0018A30093|nr:DUF6714 family protein [Acinetobacter pollinis]MBF7690783.1 hypothetical protein [Acinetobacter pollinis]MBF7698387.1 hypothetical protein [Acinetobacter pollinis]
MDFKLKCIQDIFPLKELGNHRSLLECDFYDTHYIYFDDIDDEYLSAINLSAEDLILAYNMDYPDFYKKFGIAASISRSRPSENIKTWIDVSYKYLYYFGESCSYLDSEGFKFFLPSAIYYVLLEPEKNNSFIDYFVYRLEFRWDIDSHIFNSDQKRLIRLFISEYIKRDFLWIV